MSSLGFRDHSLVVQIQTFFYRAPITHNMLRSNVQEERRHCDSAKKTATIMNYEHIASYYYRSPLTDGNSTAY